MVRLSKAQKKELYHTIKGTRDIFGDEYLLREDFIEHAKKTASFYGFGPIATPHIERTELFEATLGETTDVVEKQMYTFKTRGGESITLRPEGTAPVMRAYAEHGMHTWSQPVMFWYEGSFFRHENPQRGRFREFSQFGLEILSADDALADALIIHVLFLIIRETGLEEVTVHLNSLGCKDCRTSYRKELGTYYRKHIHQLCKDCRRRAKDNPLRVLDCKNEQCKEASEHAPQIINFLCGVCRQHLKELLEFLDEAQVPYLLDHRLVRGLDYYSRTVFELFYESSAETAVAEPEEKKPEEKEREKTDAAAQTATQQTRKTSLALASGGRYDYLGAMIGNRDVCAVGGALGIDRIIALLQEQNIQPKKPYRPKVFFIQLGLAAKRKSLRLVEALRQAKIPLAQSLSKDSIKSQLKIADRLNVPYALILGQKEAMDDTIIIRDMDSGAQETLPFGKSIDYLKQRLKGRK